MIQVFVAGEKIEKGEIVMIGKDGAAYPVTSDRLKISKADIEKLKEEYVARAERMAKGV